MFSFSCQIAFCGGGGRSGSRTEYVVKKAPSYDNPCRPSDLQSEYFTPEGSREVSVTWTAPKARDEDGDSTIVR